MIAVDWGTSNFRAFRLDERGSIVGRVVSPSGILQIPEGRFSETLRSLIGHWLALGEHKILLSGMVGSRQGWVETRYLHCPVGVSDLASTVVPLPFDGAQVMLIPGVIGKDEADVAELMRGEETEAMGLLNLGRDTATVCFPGTHSKWVQLQSGLITGFTTCMTGETYAALRSATILSKLMATDAKEDDQEFLRGVARSADPGGLLHHLFGVRTLGLVGQLAPHAAPSYLSGLLIGHEVRSAMTSSNHILLVGLPALCYLYRIAIEQCGGIASIEDQDAAARGHAAIASQMGWLQLPAKSS